MMSINQVDELQNAVSMPSDLVLVKASEIVLFCMLMPHHHSKRNLGQN